MLITNGINNCKDFDDFQGQIVGNKCWITSLFVNFEINQSQQLEDCDVELAIETTNLFGALNESGSEA